MKKTQTRKKSTITIKKKTILVIEDERPLLAAVNEKLEKSGFGVIAARSVDQVFNANLEKNDMGIISASTIKEALEYLGNLEHVDAIWLDHNLLGKENGLDFVKKIKANGGSWKKVPIFVISNTENPKTIKSYVELGISKYYIKSNHRLDQIIKDIKASLSDKAR
ncbi:MAG: response regulator [Candidatus Pacebacteria bacterium]|nr:response regulator [Candidatus Paceibacterota bacterium]